MPADARDLGHGVGRDEHRGRVGGVVGVGEDTAHRGHVAHSGAGDRTERGADPGPDTEDLRIELEPTVGHHGSDGQVAGVTETLELAHVLQRDPLVGLDQPLADQDAQERPARDDRRLGVVRTEAQHFIDAGRQVPRHDVLLLRAVLVLEGWTT